jgi:hypothetical protein
MSADYMRAVRKKFCAEDLIEDDGELNSMYFMQKFGSYWSSNDTLKLLQGIGKYGIGNWECMVMEFLPSKKACELKIQAYILLGSKHIESLNGTKLTPEDMEKIKNSHTLQSIIKK